MQQERAKGSATCSHSFLPLLLWDCRTNLPSSPPAAAAVVQYASRRVQRERIKGSATCCIVLVDLLQGRMASANLGDSGIMILGGSGGDWVCLRVWVGHCFSTVDGSCGRLGHHDPGWVVTDLGWGGRVLSWWCLWVCRAS